MAGLKVFAPDGVKVRRHAPGAAVPMLIGARTAVCAAPKPGSPTVFSQERNHVPSAPRMPPARTCMQHTASAAPAAAPVPASSSAAVDSRPQKPRMGQTRQRHSESGPLLSPTCPAHGPCPFAVHSMGGQH